MSTTTDADKPPVKRRRFTRSRVLLYLFLLFLSGATFAYIHLTDSARVAEIARDTLSKMTGAEVRIDGAAFELNGTIRLFNVDMRVPGVPGDPVGGNRLFTADQILIQHNMLALAKGGLEVESVSLIRPTFFPTEDADHGKFTFQYLKPHTKPKKKKDKSRSIDLPDVHLSQALIVFGEVSDGAYRALETVQLNGDLTRQPKETGIYSFALRQTRGERQFVLSGDFDLFQETMAAKMQLGSLMPGDRRINMLPRQVRELFQQLKPTGKFPSITFGFDNERKFHATVEIAEGGLSVPWGQTELFVENSRGSVTIEENDRLTVDLAGTARGANYGADFTVKGVVEGFEERSPFELQATLKGAIPDKPEDLHLMPAPVQSLIKQVQPRGAFDITAFATRDGASGEVMTHGQVRVIDTSIYYSGFKYPLEKLNGLVVFDNELIEIKDLKGVGPADEFGRRGAITLNGHVVGTGPRPGVHVSITAEGAPVDASLRAALDPKDEQQIFDMFFNPKMVERFMDEKTGTMQTTKQKQQRQAELEKVAAKRSELEKTKPLDHEAIGEARIQIDRLKGLLQRPVFDLGGIAKAQIDIKLNPGERRQYLVIRASAPGLQFAYENWPMPLTVVGDGELVINLPSVDGKTVIVSGGAKGLFGGDVRIDGVMRPPTERGKPLIPDLKITATGVPIDETLLLSLPPKDADIVRELGVKGKIAIDGRVMNDDQHRIDFRIGVALAGGTAIPNSGFYGLTDVDAKLTVHKRGVDIHTITAKHDDSELSVTGVPTPDGKGQTLVLEGRNMKLVGPQLPNLSEPLLSLIPRDEEAKRQIAALLDEYDPRGTFDFKLGGLSRVEGKTQYAFELVPRELSIVLNKQRVEMKQMTGKALVTPKEVKFADIRGDFGTGKFRVDGTIATGGPMAVDLGFDIGSNSYCEVTRSLLPRGALSAIDSLKIEGGYAIKDAKLRIGPPTAETPAVKFEAVVKLNDAKATIGVPITQMTGDVAIRVTEQKAGDLPAIELLVDRVRLRAAERLIDPVSVRVTSGEKPGMFNITRLKGEIYGGTITGSGAVFRQDKTDRYRMEIALQEVLLDSFLNPTDSKSDPAPPDRTAIRLVGDNPREGDGPGETPRPRNEPIVRKRAGMLSASLAVEGDAHDPNTKRGRGDLRVRDAAIYETRLGISLLQLLNLTAPVFKSFDKVEAGYLLDGDTVFLEKLSFESPSLVISGKGKMKYSTQELDLVMTSANPRGLELGPVTDVLKLLKDELVSIRVGGTLTAPEARVQSLKGITGAVDEVLGKPKEPKRVVPPVRE